MLCDIERDLGAVLCVDVAAKITTGYMYFPLYGEETINAEGEKTKPIIGFEFMDVKGNRFNVKTSKDPFIYNFDKLVDTKFLGLAADCPDWSVYADFMEDGIEKPQPPADYKPEMKIVKRPIITGYTEGIDPADGMKTETPIYGPDEEYEEQVAYVKDITADIDFLRGKQDAGSYADRVNFIEKVCKWEVS